MGVGVPCLPVLTFVLYKVCVLGCIAQHLLAELGWQSCNVPMGRNDNQYLILMWYVPHHALPHHTTRGSSHNPFQNQKSNI